jgi:hypothetical protein
MTEHAAELIPVLLTLIGFFAVYVLNGIRAELKDLKTTVKSLESDLRGGVANLDRRITRIEARCNIKHGEHAQD